MWKLDWVIDWRRRRRRRRRGVGGRESHDSLEPVHRCAGTWNRKKGRKKRGRTEKKTAVSV